MHTCVHAIVLLEGSIQSYNPNVIKNIRRRLDYLMDVSGNLLPGKSPKTRLVVNTDLPGTGTHTTGTHTTGAHTPLAHTHH